MVSYVEARHRFLCILAPTAFLAGFLLSGLSCTKDVYVYPTIPAPSPEPTYHLIVFYNSSTQRIYGTDTLYNPAFEDMDRCNGWWIPGQALSVIDEPPWNGFVLNDPHIKFYPETKILQLFNTWPFAVDSAVSGIYAWSDVHIHGNCIDKDANIGHYGRLPLYFPLDSSIRVLKVYGNGTAVLSIAGLPASLASNDSLKLFARSDTVAVQDRRVPGTNGPWRTIQYTDTLVIRNYGLLPKKYVIFDHYFNGDLTGKEER